MNGIFFKLTVIFAFTLLSCYATPMFNIRPGDSEENAENHSIRKRTNADIEITESVHRERSALMRQLLLSRLLNKVSGEAVEARSDNTRPRNHNKNDGTSNSEDDVYMVDMKRDLFSSKQDSDDYDLESSDPRIAKSIVSVSFPNHLETKLSRELLAILSEVQEHYGDRVLDSDIQQPNGIESSHRILATNYYQLQNSSLRKASEKYRD